MKKKPLTSLFLILVLVVGSWFVSTPFLRVAKASTSVSGAINSDTVWTKDNSPYTLTGPVLVNSSVELKIEPGVTVQLGDYYLKVDGTLNARGNANDRITLISDGTPGVQWTGLNWGIVFFSGLSSPWNDQTNSGSIVENAYIFSNQRAPTVNIKHASPKISQCTVINTGGQRSIWISGGSSIISGNNITSTMEGISIDLGTCNALIADNIISGCEVGVEIYGGSPIVERNLIVNNTGSKIGGNGGLRIDYPGTSPLIRNNTIAQNSVGFNLLDSPSPQIAFNNIQDNMEYGIYLYSGSTSNVNATYNWWGTTDSQSINQTIRDFKNDFSLGTVLFQPFLVEPNLQAPFYTDAQITIATPEAAPANLTSTSPSQSSTPDTAPAPSEPPVTTPAQPDGTDVGSKTGMSATDVSLIVLAAVVVVLLLVIAVLVVRRRQPKPL